MTKTVIYDQIQMRKCNKSMHEHGIFNCLFPHIEEGHYITRILQLYVKICILELNEHLRTHPCSLEVHIFCLEKFLKK